MTFVHRGRTPVEPAAASCLVGSLGCRVGEPNPSADLLCQLDDDSFGAADVAEPVAVLVAFQLADELSAAGSHAGDDRVDVFDDESDMADARCVRRRVPVAGLGRRCVEFDSSSRAWPSGVCSMAISDRTPSSPTTRSTQRPSTDPSPCSSSPSSTKNSIAAARSSTTMPTWSILRIVMCSMVRNPGSSRGARPEKPRRRLHLHYRSSGPFGSAATTPDLGWGSVGARTCRRNPRKF
jgi:hypothetical protein